MAVELCVVIPVLNEAAVLPDLFRMLEAQKDCRFEVIFGDGGSQDATLDILNIAALQGHVPLSVVQSARGRGCQMNAAARQARCEWLLFLHADSRIQDAQGLAKSLDYVKSHLAQQGDHRFAARFSLRFARSTTENGLSYYFYEEKARLTLPGCIHGDQGWLMHRRFFEELGPFDENLPFFEDEKLAEAINAQGTWLLLPVELWTSARRFEKEGLKERQTLNALLMNFHHIGWTSFLLRAPQIYRLQAQAERLDLAPFFSLVDQLLQSHSVSEQQHLWRDTGRYVRSQAWQPLFALVTLVRYVSGRAHRTNAWGTSFCALWERWTDHPPINSLVAAGVKFWFYRTWRRLQRRSS